MKFQLTINTNDQDYLDYNKFWMLRSHYGKKQMTTFRIVIAVINRAYFIILNKIDELDGTNERLLKYYKENIEKYK